MEQLKETIGNSRKIVIKIGSNVLSDEKGSVNKDVIHNIVEQVKELTDMRKQVILVSSGAGICGVGAINKWSRREDINYRQALCAIGQVELMMAYKEYFADYDMHVAQILLTRDDFDDPHRTLNIRNAMFTLIDEGVVPVINENDSVSVDEIKIGDNDILAALTASLWNADLMIILSDIDGVFDSDRSFIKNLYTNITRRYQRAWLGCIISKETSSNKINLKQNITGISIRYGIRKFLNAPALHFSVFFEK